MKGHRFFFREQIIMTQELSPLHPSTAGTSRGEFLSTAGWMAEDTEVNGRYQELHDELCSLLLESAGQGRLDKICMMATHQPDILQTKGDFGVTIAHVAAFYGQWHILEFLSKTDPKFLFEEANDGGTPAHHAAAAGRTETLKYLASQSLSHMVARDLDGWTPAHVASYYGRAETLILMAKVSPSVLGIATNAGRTPKDLCQSAECRQLIECLEKIVSDAGSGSPLRGQVARDKADLSQLMSVLSVSPLSKATQKTNQHNVCGNQAGATHGDGNHAEQRFPGDGGGHRKRLTMSVSGGVGQECVQAENTSSTLSENRGASALAGGRNGEHGKEGAAGGRGEELDGEERVTWTQDVTTMEQEAQWKLLLRDLRKGADLTNMVIPAQFIRPQSVLERLAFLMQHGKYLEGISSASSPLARLKAVVSFHMSGLVREVFDGKKPYNPILGETCAWAFRHPESGKGVTRMVCEQVSHHPPISAMHIHNETLGISVEGAALIEAKFTGNTVLVPFKGTRKLRIHGLDEEYLLTVPSLQYRGVMLGPKVAFATFSLACRLQPDGSFGTDRSTTGGRVDWQGGSFMCTDEVSGKA